MRISPRLRAALEEVAAATHESSPDGLEPDGWNVTMNGVYDPNWDAKDDDGPFPVLLYEVPVLIGGRAPTEAEFTAKARMSP